MLNCEISADILNVDPQSGYLDCGSGTPNLIDVSKSLRLFPPLKSGIIISPASQDLGRNDAKAETPVLWPPHAKS